MKKAVVITFGRFNPPTIGHEKLLQKVQTTAKNNDADFFIYASHSTDKKKNPLPYPKKVYWMKKAFPAFSKNIITSNNKTILEIAVELSQKKYSKLIVVVGSDRVEEFKKLLVDYNRIKSRHGQYSFDSISVVSAGDRDPDSDSVEGISASKLRQAALDDNYSLFSKGIPSLTDNEKKKLYKDVRQGMLLENIIMSFSEFREYNI